MHTVNRDNFRCFLFFNCMGLYLFLQSASRSLWRPGKAKKRPKLPQSTVHDLQHYLNTLKPEEKIIQHVRWSRDISFYRLLDHLMSLGQDILSLDIWKWLEELRPGKAVVIIRILVRIQDKIENRYRSRI